MSEVETFYNLERLNAFGQPSKHGPVELHQGYLVYRESYRLTSTLDRYQLRVVGRLVGRPFVVVRYKDSRERLITAKLTIEAVDSEMIIETINLRHKLIKWKDYCSRVPVLRRRIGRIIEITTAVRYTPIETNWSRQVAEKVGLPLGYYPSQVVFWHSDRSCQ
jgi:hypothetical protein